MLKPGELNPNKKTSDVMSYAIIMDSFGILNAANKWVRQQGGQVTGPLLEKALREVGICGSL